ncbi:MAG TPA: hypothetical protein VFB32_12180 [Rudaea sp.]|nr:hypothetical protein [Rudaea sp.]
MGQNKSENRSQGQQQSHTAGRHGSSMPGGTDDRNRASQSGKNVNQGGGNQPNRSTTMGQGESEGTDEEE